MAEMESNLENEIVACSSQGEIGMDNIAYLPEDIITNIIKRLPAEYLHLVARCVCKAWARILRDPNFIESQMLHSDSCLLVQKSEEDASPAQFLNITEHGTSVMDLNCPIRGLVLGSLEGIILIWALKDGSMFVTNPDTIRYVKLPEPPTGVRFDVSNSTIYRIPCCGEIKVLCRGFWSIDDSTVGLSWFAITIGDRMSWRKLNIDHIRFGTEHETGKRVCVGGVYYFSCSNDTSGHFIFAMDLSAETTHRLQGPLTSYDRSYDLVEMGNYLCCVTYKSTVIPGARLKYGREMTELEIWQLKDLYEEEWSLVKRIDLAKGIPSSSYFRPIAWLRHHQVLIFMIANAIVAYYERTGEWKTIEENTAYTWEIYSHTSSLISG